MGDVTLNPYLNFEGVTREALEFYKGVFGGELTISTFSDTPDMEVPEGYEDKVMHGDLVADDVRLMASEGPPGRPVTVGDNVTLSLSGTDSAKLTAYFEGLSDGGQVTMPLGEVPWGDVFGMVVDRYGINWLIDITKE